jgi:hypothetical protein
MKNPLLLIFILFVTSCTSTKVNLALKLIFAIVILKTVYDIICFVTNLHELGKFIPKMIFNTLLLVILL